MTEAGPLRSNVMSPPVFPSPGGVGVPLRSITVCSSGLAGFQISADPRPPQPRPQTSGRLSGRGEARAVTPETAAHLPSPWMGLSALGRCAQVCARAQVCVCARKRSGEERGLSAQNILFQCPRCRFPRTSRRACNCERARVRTGAPARERTLRLARTRVRAPALRVKRGVNPSTLRCGGAGPPSSLNRQQALYRPAGGSRGCLPASQPTAGPSRENPSPQIIPPEGGRLRS